MSRFVFSLLLFLFSSFAFSATVVSDGSDGLFNPSGATVLTVPVDGIFNFTSIDLASDVDLSFDRAGFTDTIWLAATDDIQLTGLISWTGDLGIVTESGNLTLTGPSSLTGGDNLTLEATTGSINVNGDVTIIVEETITIQVGEDLTGDGIIEVGEITIGSGVTITAGGTGIATGIDPGTIGLGDITIDPGDVTLTVIPVPMPVILLLSALSFLLPSIRKAD